MQEPPVVEWPFDLWGFTLRAELLMVIGTIFWEFFMKSCDDLTKQSINKLARNISKYNNTLYGIFSLLMAICSIFIFFQRDLNSLHTSNNDIQTSNLSQIWCEQLLTSSNQFKNLFVIFYFSKIYEITDLILVISMSSSVSLHFRTHHYTTLLVVATSVHGNLACMFPTLLLNATHHFFMYVYFGVGIQSFRKILPFSGTLQLVVGVGCALNSIYFKGCGINSDPNSSTINAQLFCLFMYCVYFSLHMYDLHKERKESNTLSKQQKND